MIESALTNLWAPAEAFRELQSVTFPDLRSLGIVLAVVVTLCHIYHILDSSKRLDKPLIGYRSIFEPRWLLGLRFTKGGQALLREGYRKVCDFSCRTPRSVALTAVSTKMRSSRFNATTPK